MKFAKHLALILIGMAAAKPAIASLQSDCEKAKTQWQKAIVACTALIDSGFKLENTHWNRSIAYDQSGQHDLAIADLNEVIARNPKRADAHYNRGTIYRQKGTASRPFDKKLLEQAVDDLSRAVDLQPQDYSHVNNLGLARLDLEELDLAIADFGRAIALKPREALAYLNRAIAYRRKGDYAEAIEDCNKAISLDPSSYRAIGNRGNNYLDMREFNKAVADYTAALKINKKEYILFTARAYALLQLRDFKMALADVNTAIALDPKRAFAYRVRGMMYSRTDDEDFALRDFNKALSIDPEQAEALVERGRLFVKRGLKEKAREDFRGAMALPASTAAAKEFTKQARAELNALDAATAMAATPTAQIRSDNPSTPVPLGRRVALVIGNSAYSDTAKLPNTATDARDIAASLRRLGFAEVEEKYDLALAQMTAAIRDFGDKATDADWAVVYYAGHGLEMNGTTYLIPVDAKLARDTHVADEAVALDRVIGKVEGAKRLRLVILDSCRNNPFVNGMTRSAANRAVTRGLARVEPDGGVLVAYAAKHGTTAADGSDGANSPFAEALLAHLEEPGLELQYLFRKVRDRVLERTARSQEPFLYGSLSSENLYFKPQ